MIESSDYMCADLMMEYTLKIGPIVFQGHPDFEYSFFFEERDTCPRKAVIFKPYLYVLSQA